MTSSVSGYSTNNYTHSSENDVNNSCAAYYRIVPPNAKLDGAELPFDAITLCGMAKTNARLYCDDYPNTRRKLYTKQNPKEVKALSKKTTIKVLKEDAAKNSSVMAISTIICGGIGSIGWIAGPAGGAPGTTIGVGLGMAIGGYVIKKHINKKIAIAIDISSHYAQWRSKAIADKVYPVFRNFLDVDNEFANFMCPIAQDICSVPMKAPDGHTYNYEDINKYILSHTSSDDVKVESPLRIKKFSRNELLFDTEYCRNLIEKAEKVYQQVVAQGRANEIKYGVDAVIKNTLDIMEKVRKQMVSQMWDTLDDLVQNGEMTEAEMNNAIRNATAQWDFRDRKRKS